MYCVKEVSRVENQPAFHWGINAPPPSCQWAWFSQAHPAVSGILPLLLSNSVTKYKIFEHVFKHYQLCPAPSVFVTFPFVLKLDPHKNISIKNSMGSLQTDSGWNSCIYGKSLPVPLPPFFGSVPKIKCQKCNWSQLLWNRLCHKTCFTLDTLWPCFGTSY